MLSKRLVMFSSDSKFEDALREFNLALGSIPGSSAQKYPLMQYISGKGGYKNLAEDSVKFRQVMESILPGLVKQLQERPPGSKRGISDFYSRLSTAALTLLSAGHDAGKVSFPFVKAWTLKILNEVKPGSPFEKDIPEAEKELAIHDRN